MSINDFNARIIEDFRVNKGKVGKPFESATLLLLHSTGAKSGLPRVNPLAYTIDAKRFVIIAAKEYSQTHPDWYYNLKTHPRVTIEVGESTLNVTPAEALGDERARLFNGMAAGMPILHDYQSEVRRTIPVFTLTAAVPAD